MRYIELEGQRYPLKGRFGTIAKLLKKYDLLKLTNGGWGEDESIYIDFVLESTWKLIEPEGLFKPYVFFRRFKKKVIFSEIMAAQGDILGILYGISEKDIEEEAPDEDENSKKKVI